MILNCNSITLNCNILYYDVSSEQNTLPGRLLHIAENSKKVQEGDATKADSSSAAWTKKLIELWLN